MGERRVLALVGPTAAGKSALALEAAERLGAEIVAVDAFTVYRGMDIGTAKPDARARARVPHHLVDVLDPAGEATVEWFQQKARAAIDDVVRRGRVPLLVGGSGLYFRAVVDDLEFPPTDAAVRRDLETRYADDPVGAWEALADLDPDAAARMDRRNVRRAVRALEVITLTGRRFSDYRRAWDRHESRYAGLRVVGVALPRDVLHERIEQRVAAMVSAGLLDECRRLGARSLSRTARQAIGYAEMFDHLEGRCPLEDAVARTVARTRQFAGRQLRWFAADPRVVWHPPEDAVAALVT